MASEATVAPAAAATVSTASGPAVEARQALTGRHGAAFASVARRSSCTTIEIKKERDKQKKDRI